jgi:hypothetical protein
MPGSSLAAAQLGLPSLQAESAWFARYVKAYREAGHPSPHGSSLPAGLRRRNIMDGCFLTVTLSGGSPGAEHAARCC